MHGFRRSAFVFVVFTALTTAASSVTGCGALRRLAGTDTISLEKADVRSITIDLRRPNKTICPREPVQMAVFAEIVLEGDKSAKRVETWAGRGDNVNKNDKLDFADFGFQSEQGKFDQEGWFTPNPNVLATASREFEIKSIFRRQPEKFPLGKSYKPDYGCIKTTGGGGSAGRSGNPGAGGDGGKEGAAGSTSSSGGAGGAAGPGSPGGDAGDGAPGPNVKAFATVVKSPFYDRLVAISLQGGDASDFVLVHEGQAVTIRATGGSGGQGGRGGDGGPGGPGGNGNPGGPGGNGGSGAHGGNGGHGGPGGTIDLVYDARFPNIAGQIRIDVAGGPAGSAGEGGRAGSAGRGGSGMTPSGSSGQTPPTAQAGAAGSEGSGGGSGASGRSGPPGRASAKPGDVADKFRSVPGLTLL